MVSKCMVLITIGCYRLLYQGLCKLFRTVSFRYGFIAWFMDFFYDTSQIVKWLIFKGCISELWHTIMLIVRKRFGANKLMDGSLTLDLKFDSKLGDINLWGAVTGKTPRYRALVKLNSTCFPTP